MKIFSIVFLVFNMVSVNVYAVECQKNYESFPILKEEGWSLRIDNKTDTYGCGIIKIYDSLRTSDNIILLDAIDENPKILIELQKLYQNKNIFDVMQSNRILKNIISNNADNYILLKNLNYLLDKHMHYGKINALQENAVYINYFLLPAANAKDEKQLDDYYRKLNKTSLKGLELFSFIYASIGDDYSFEYLLENFRTVKDMLSQKQLKEISLYPAYLAYFLYPSADDMKLHGNNIKYKQREFQQMMITIYKNVYEFYQYKQDIDENKMALITMEYIYPYIVTNRNYNEMHQLFQVLVKKGYIHELWNNISDPCDKKDAREVFAVFGDNNLYNLFKLQKHENDLYHQLLDSNSPNNNISSLFYIANVYAKFDHKKWEIFKNLLHTLPEKDLYTNVFVLKELDDIGYFEKIIKYNDYKAYVDANDDDAQGRSIQKYKFILFTSYPSDNDPSVYQYLISSHHDVAKNYLNKLYGLTIDNLQTHNFITFEKNMALVDKLDWALTGAAIIAAPFTGGMSLGYIALKQSAKQAGKVAVKKGIKYYAKQIALKSRKLLNKGISKARKVESTLGKENTKAFGKGLDKVSDTVSNFELGATVGGMLYRVLQKDLEAKEICKEK